MTIETRCRNRLEAGKLLASNLAQNANRRDLLVLAITHGVMTVAFEVALLPVVLWEQTLSALACKHMTNRFFV